MLPMLLSFWNICTKALDAVDVNDSGEVDIADAIKLLGYLFSRDPAPAEPFATCGQDTTADDLGCQSFPTCQ